MVALPDPGQIIKWFGGPVDLRVEVDTPFLDSGDFALYDVAQYDVDTYGTDDPEWTDVSPYVLQVATSAGRTPPEERYETGTATFVLDNTSGIWTPDTNLTSPWYLPWRPGRRIRLIAIPDPDSNPLLPESKVPLWTGEVSEALDQFGDGGYDIETVVIAVDFMGRLGRINPLGMVSPTGVQRSDQRVHAALDRADWPMDQRDIDSGLHTMQSSHLAQSTLEECHAAAESEGGAFFVSPSGVVTFRNRDWITDPLIFEDDFTGTVIDSAKWDLTAAGSIVQDDVLILESGNLASVSSLLTSSYVAVFEIPQLGSTSDDSLDVDIGAQTIGGHHRVVNFSENLGGFAFAMKFFADGSAGSPESSSFIEYNSVAHRWFKFEAVVEGCKWSTAPSQDGPWTVQFSTVNYFEDDAFWEIADGSGTLNSLTHLDNLTIAYHPDAHRTIEIQGYLGYDTEQEVGVPHARLLDVRPSWDTARIRNDIQLALIGGVAYQVEDSASIGLFDRRSHRRYDYQNNAQADIELLADRKLAAWKDNRMRIDSVTISANEDLSNEDLNRLFWDSRFGDLISIKVKTGQGWEYEKLVHIVGISHQIDSDDWVVTFVLDDFFTV